jgi:membrane fusion protein (multidrug efflux system)
VPEAPHPRPVREKCWPGNMSAQPPDTPRMPPGGVPGSAEVGGRPPEGTTAARPGAVPGGCGAEARTPGRQPSRRLLPLLAGAGILLLAIGVWWWRVNAGWVKTDNAQTAGDLYQISAQVSGIVASVPVHQDQYVKARTVLVTLDPTPFRVALAQARMQLAQAQAQAEAARAALAAQEQTTATNISAAQAALAATTPTVTQAEATLKQQAATNTQNIVTSQQQVALARAKLRSVEAQLAVARQTVARDKTLVREGAIAAQQLDLDTSAEQAAEAQVQDARSALASAEAALTANVAGTQGVIAARQQVIVNRQQVAHAAAMVGQAEAGEAVVQQDAKQLAAAKAQAGATAQAVRNARLNLGYTVIRAPADGWVVSWVTGPTVTVGQVVAPNLPLMWVTGRHVWVMANIKETQLGGVRVGDPVRITVDVLRGRVFQGHVASLGSASGSTTALLPPDNATGNFVKVVQLVPVRIEFDHDPPFRDGVQVPQIPVGVSAEVAIDTRRPPAR